MSTTSKLGADMLKDLEEIRSTLKNASCMSDYGDAVEMLSDLIDTLASQPAAIGKEEAKLCTICNGYGRYQDGDSGTESDGYAPNIVECDCAPEERHPASPSVEQDERGAFAKWFRDEVDKRNLGPGDETAALSGWQARAASTSANVAQNELPAFRAIASALLHIDVRGVSIGDKAIIQAAIDALNSANVAQGAEAVRDSRGEQVRLMEWRGGAGLLWDVYAFGKWSKRIVSPIEWDAHTVYLDMVRAGYAEHIELRLVSSSNNANRDEPNLAPPAPPALTDAEGKRLPSLEEIQNLRDHGHGEEAAWWLERRNAALTASQSASGDTK